VIRKRQAVSPIDASSAIASFAAISSTCAWLSHCAKPLGVAKNSWSDPFWRDRWPRLASSWGEDQGDAAARTDPEVQSVSPAKSCANLRVGLHSCERDTWLETGRKSLFEIWTEREGLALLDARSNEEIDEAEWVRVVRPRRAVIALFVLGLYVVVNIVAIEVLLRGGSLEQDALGYFLRAKGGGFIARLSESEGAWILASFARFLTSATMFVFFFANCVWRIPPAPHAEIA
jgi:hypothetical protein